VTTIEPDIRLTNFQGTHDDQRRPVPESLSLRHLVEGKDFVAKQLAREGYGEHAIADALQLDLNAVRRMIGAEL
jgi:hypothetical protein